MAKFCIPKDMMKKVVDSIGGLDKDMPISKLVSMKPSERIALFRKNLSNDAAEKLSKELDGAIYSWRMGALKNWVKKNLDPEYRAEFEANKIENKFKTLEALDDYIAQNSDNFVMQKMGVALKAKEMLEFNRLGKDTYKAQQALGDNLGDIINHYDTNLGYLDSIKKLSDYTQNISPSSKMKVFTKSVGKAVMLLSFKSPLLNVISNTVQGMAEGLSRRFSNAAIGGKVGNKLLFDYIKKANKIFNATGIDITRMINLEDPVAGMGRTLGEQLATPKGKITRAFTDFVFNKTLSAPDVAFASMHYADSANILATKYAGGNKAKAQQIFLDSLRIEPLTKEGQVVRAMSVADAMYATFTNEGAVARVNEGIRKLLGPAGDLTIPFVKTPSNVVESGLDYSGVGALKGLYNLFSEARAGNLKSLNRESVQQVMRGVVRSGLGLTGAYLAVQAIKPEDFMGAYDPQRVGIDQLKNTTYNAVKIGGKWINVDYFGPLATPIVSMLYAKKYGKDEGRVNSFLSGMIKSGTKAPAIEPLAEIVNSMLAVDPETGKSLPYAKLPQTVLDTLSSRLWPGGLYDLAKMLDDVQRDTRQRKYAIKTPFIDINFDPIIAKIPFIRKNLREKRDSLGRVMFEEDPVSSLLFGARVRTSRDDKITDEIFRLRDAGKKPTIKDLRFMRSKNVEKLKEKLGEERFYEVAIRYGEELAKRFDKVIGKSSYRKLDDEEKKEELTRIGTELYNELLIKYEIKD